MNLLQHCLIPDWPAPKNVRALQTTRNGGFSIAPYHTLNLGDHVGDAPLAVERNRILLQALLPSEPVWLQQVHGSGVVDAGVVDAAQADCWPQADACVSTHPGAVCVVMTADCLPLLLCDDRGSVVAAVHAGWRGLCNGVIEKTVQAMKVPPATLMAWLGPAIGPAAFEVGAEVRAAFVARQAQAAAAFRPRPSPPSSPSPGLRPPSPASGRGVGGEGGEGGEGREGGEGSARDKYLADIYQLARLRLHALGITRISGGAGCTYSDAAKFFSYRRDGITGRMGTFIWLDNKA